MTKNEQTRIEKMLSTMLANKKQPTDEANICMFMMALEDLSFEDVVKGIKHVLKNGTKGYLEPADIVRAAGPSDDELEMEASEQWQIFREAVVSWPNPKFGDVVTAYLAQNEFNIWAIKDGTEDNLNRKEAKFIKAYVASHKNKEIYENIERKAQGIGVLSNNTKLLIAEKLEQQQGIVKS